MPVRRRLKVKPKQARRLRALDLFAGAGGASWGAKMAGVEVVAAVDSWELATKTYRDNFHQKTSVYNSLCQNLSPNRLLQEVGDIDLLLASPECTSHSCAKGNGVRSEASRITAFEVPRFAAVFKPRWVVVENVVQMKSWDRYSEWLQSMRALGYKVSEQTLDASEFGAPQSRRRLFVICDLKREPPRVVADPRIKVRTVEDILDMNGSYPYSRLWSTGRASATLLRARRAIRALGKTKPFLMVYYGTDAAGGWQALDRPLRTVTTVDRFAYVRPLRGGKREMRMLQVPEIRAAMGLSKSFELNHGTRRDRIRLLGNAVCPQVVAAIIRSITRQPCL